ncbi:hypothetical protein SteCoe_10942 [Stentor coeruleus]|uniref:Uncharacterized protein n=1 Tax=Stentor coeruleus TaxID=5963 RepID=A0A1R2CE92_9CILI|nr:hypothetical protein SteCoe_10942 [Stentor coeruleus]
MKKSSTAPLSRDIPKQFQLSPIESIEKSYIISILNVLLNSKDFTNIIREISSEPDSLIEDLNKFLAQEMTLLFFLTKHLFLSSCDFCYKLSRLIPSSAYIQVTSEDIESNPSISYIQIPPTADLVFFIFPDQPLYKNIDNFQFTSQRLETNHELFGVIFKKKNYFIGFYFTVKGWVFCKNSGKQIFMNWAEGCAVAYEMGMSMHIMFYVRNVVSFEEPENMSEVMNIMQEFSEFYKEVPRNRVYFNN